MEEKEIKQAIERIQEPFEVDFSASGMDEKAILALLAERVAEMLERQPDYLMSLLYRMDVLERDIKAVLHPGFPALPHEALAHLIWERQKARIASRAAYKSDDDGVPEDWKW